MINSENREWWRLGAVAGAAAGAVVLWAVAQLGLGVRVQAPASSGFSAMELGPALVAGTAAVLSLIGWGVLALLERLTDRAATIWLVLAPIILLLSLSMPLSGSGVSAVDRAALVLIHVAVAAVLIPAFYVTAPRRAPRRRVPGRPFATGAQV